MGHVGEIYVPLKSRTIEFTRYLTSGIKNNVDENGYNSECSFLPCWDTHEPLHRFRCGNFGYLEASKVLKTTPSLSHNFPKIIGGEKDKIVLFLITGQ